ncbi:MAG: hypothetical protein Q8M17_10085, partial [Actinomycetota bacterium]|nr:hypothetical protein [Actinomycetota bacterium]
AGVARGHAEIVDMVRSAAAADPARGHAVLLNADVLGVIRSTDLMIADVSSVSLDHLYLRPDAPLALTDRRTNRARLLEDAPVAAGAHVVDESSIGTLDQALASMVSHDSMREARHGLRDLYFDALAPGQSTVRFWQELERAMHEHDQALRELSRLRVVDDVAEDRR